MTKHPRENWKSVGQRVRFEIMGIITKSQGGCVKIPSAQKLADKLGISRMSVVAELKKLAQEGYLIGKTGSGTYTNPEKIRSMRRDFSGKLIGIIVGDSRGYVSEYTNWVLQSRVGMKILQTGNLPRLLTLSDPLNTELSEQELLSAGLDGLIWIFPFQSDLPGAFLTDRLNRNHLPTVSLFAMEGTPRIVPDAESSGRELCRRFLAEGRKKLLWDHFFASDPFLKVQFRSAAECFKENGFAAEKYWDLVCNEELSLFLERQLQNGIVPDGIICHTFAYGSIRPVLEKYGIDTQNQCRISILAHELIRFPDFCGIVRREPHNLLADTAVELMLKMLDGEKVPDATLLPLDVFARLENEFVEMR
ncbi:MAG: GntR family transcriptional regulator [Lentisphaeria bacterium]|nr:GntR family transcriptional regulator [Lentisphaeria bacterium]